MLEALNAMAATMATIEGIAWMFALVPQMQYHYRFVEIPVGLFNFPRQHAAR